MIQTHLIALIFSKSSRTSDRGHQRPRTSRKRQQTGGGYPTGMEKKWLVDKCDVPMTRPTGPQHTHQSSEGCSMFSGTKALGDSSTISIPVTVPNINVELNTRSQIIICAYSMAQSHSQSTAVAGAVVKNK